MNAAVHLGKDHEEHPRTAKNKNFDEINLRSTWRENSSLIKNMNKCNIQDLLVCNTMNEDVLCCMKMLFSNRQQKFTFSQKLFFVLEAGLLNTHNLYSFGWTELNCLHNFLIIVNSTELIWNQFCSSARFSQDTPRKPKASWKKNKFSFTDSKIESSACRCTTTLTRATKNVVGAIAQVLPHMPQGFPMGSGHYSDLDSEEKWYATLVQKPDISLNKVAKRMMLAFGESGHLFAESSASVREASKAKEVEEHRCTTTRAWWPWATFIQFCCVWPCFVCDSLFLILLVAFCSWWFWKFVLYPVCRSFKEIRRLWWKVPRLRHWEPSTKGPSCIRDPRIWLKKDGKNERSLPYLTSWLIWLQWKWAIRRCWMMKMTTKIMWRMCQNQPNLDSKGRRCRKEAKNELILLRKTQKIRLWNRERFTLQAEGTPEGSNAEIMAILANLSKSMQKVLRTVDCSKEKWKGT